MRSSLTILGVAAVLAIPVFGRDAAAGTTVEIRNWRQQTDFEVDKAKDNGVDETDREDSKSWKSRSSGTAIRVGYVFDDMVSVFGEFGSASVTIRERDQGDSSSWAFDDGRRYALGVAGGGDLPVGDDLFWLADLTYSKFTTDYEKDPTTDVDYEETGLSLGGAVGMNVTEEVGVYGGLRYTSTDVEFEEDDSSGPDVLTIDFERKDSVNLIIGVRAKTERVSASLEMSMGESHGVTAAIGYSF